MKNKKLRHSQSDFETDNGLPDWKCLRNENRSRMYVERNNYKEILFFI